MSLPSQTARTSPAGRSFVYKGRRKRRRPPPIVLAVGGSAALLMIVVGVILFGPGLGGPSSAEAGSDGGATNGEGEAPPQLAIHEPLPTDGRRDGLSPIPRVEHRARAQREDTTTLSGGNSLGNETQGEGSRTALTPPPMAPERGMLAEALGGNERDTEGESGGQPSAGARFENPPVDSQQVRPSAGNGRIAMHLDAADQLMLENDMLAARQALWDAIRLPGLDAVESQVLRDRLTALNEAIVFSGPHRAGDPLTTTYKVRPGDALSRIAREQKLGTHWKLIQRVNGLKSPNHIRAGQTLKLVRGPFHAIVDKSDFRLDLYHGPTERPSDWVYVRSFRVGLGEGDSTPMGRFVVRDNSKLENPGWVNPRNPSDKYDPDDPGNPIGEYWVGLDGLGDAAVYAGYGIHGTIDPDSIGRERSMGCVRLGAADVELIYELLGEGESLVEIKR